MRRPEFRGTLDFCVYSLFWDPDFAALSRGFNSQLSNEFRYTWTTPAISPTLEIGFLAALSFHEH